MKRPQFFAIVILFMTLFMNCSKTATVEEIAGCWEGNVMFFNHSHSEFLQLQLNEKNEYFLKAHDTGKHLISSGEFSLQNGHIIFTPTYVQDTNQIGMLMDLSNRPVKVLDRNDTKGLQIKMNDVWHFLEKTN